MVLVCKGIMVYLWCWVDDNQRCPGEGVYHLEVEPDAVVFADV